MQLGSLSRREMLNLGVSATAASVIVAREARAQDCDSKQQRIIDTNASLFQWPFRRLPLDDTTTLVAKLRTLGIAQAWAGSFEGLLHRDITQVNHRLAEACKQWPELVPIGSINPELPDWEEDLRRCVEQHQMPGIRLHPNYHGYTLDDPRFARLLQLATAAGRFVQLSTAMEDTRTQHPLVHVTDVDLATLPEIMSQVAGARVQLLNYRPTTASIDSLKRVAGLYIDTARVESTDGVPNLMNRARPGQVLFGTHAPLLVPEAALIRVSESALLDDAALRALLCENAERFAGTKVKK